jgi:hypothetical protein
MKYLSKSDFKVAQSCPTKLFYKKQKYVSAKDSNEYLALLADGGFMIGKLAQMLYPDGIEIVEGRGIQELAIEQTEKLLSENENITLFEPAIFINNQLVRIDILIKTGNRFQLIEVKSKSYSSEKLAESKSGKKRKSYWGDSDFLPYLEDVAFQKKVLVDKFPESQVQAYLMMPDICKINEHENLIKWFVLSKSEGTTSVDFVGTEEDAARLRFSNFMGLECVDAEIEEIKSTIKESADQYIESILKSQKIEANISVKCRDCEYRVATERSGFSECWGKLADPTPNILELGQLGNINRRKGYSDVINNLISNGKTALCDVPVDAVFDEEKPVYNDRPFYQLAIKNEFMMSDFQEAIKDIEMPLHFIDFETCQMAVPFHANMRPFQNVIFQWSCHTLYADGTIQHFEWLNTDDYYPNFEFARSLRNCIGDKGTVMIWSKYENTQLKAILSSLEERVVLDPALKRWLESMILDEESAENRMLDMLKLTAQYYFHPQMGGRTSIKVVLPSVLRSTKSPKIIDWLAQENLYAETESGMLDPYLLLEKKISKEANDYHAKVKNGSDAMIAYREMLYGESRNDQNAKDAINGALKKYCKLDTLAMLIIWEHWQDMIKTQNLTTRANLIDGLVS